jgi:hypothetical protein
MVTRSIVSAILSASRAASMPTLAVAAMTLR